jgi:lipid A 3-O-deacylase
VAFAAGLSLATPSFSYDLIAGAPDGSPPDQGSVVGTHGDDATDTRDYDRGGIFDEVRLGASAFVGGDGNFDEDGAFISGQVLFDPLLGRFDNAFADILLRPRIQLGASIATGGGTDQAFAGLAWDVPIGRLLFVEATFGGTVHDGDLHEPPGQPGIELGCRALFRESIGLGVNFGHWDILAAVDHSSNAGLCADNDGLTHAGASIGYRF